MVVPLREFDRFQDSQDVKPVARRDTREEFANNSESRCPVLLLLDTSSSMTSLMERLMRGTQVMADTLAANSLAAKRAEIAIVTFGGGVYLPQAFATVHHLKIPPLSAQGTTPMATAILRGLQYVEERQQEYNQNGISSYEPFIFLLTDGEPTDGDLWDAAVRKVTDCVQNKDFRFFPIGVGDDANLEKLAELGGFPPKLLDATKFDTLFQWIGNSMNRYSMSRKGDTVRLDPPDPWCVDLKVR
jgi:uncharacterized protein YegL